MANLYALRVSPGLGVSTVSSLPGGKKVVPEKKQWSWGS